MKIINILLLIFTIIPLNSMIKKNRFTPIEIIQKNSSDPSLILSIFQNYQLEDLINFRYGPNNNVFHYITETFVQQKNSIKNLPQVIERYKPLLEWLTRLGVNINHINHDYDTPYAILRNGNDDEKLNALENFFTHKLKAEYSYLPDPLILVRKYIVKTLTCDWCNNKQS